MDELNKPEEPIEEEKEEFMEEEDEELGVTDKIVSVLSEPGELFSTLSKLPVKTMDWLLPILLVIVIAIISTFTLMSNPEIKADMMDKQMEQIEQNFQDAVDNGQMTQEQADQQLDAIQERMDQAGSGQAMISSVFIVIVTFITFFIIAGVFLLLAKFALGGTGDYKTSMLAYGMPHYIIVIQIVVMIIAAIGMGKMFMDTSVGSFTGIGKEGLYGWLMHKLDPFSIWFYAVVGIAFAKMFKSENTMKYIIAIFAMWIGFSLLFHFLAEALPFLRWFGM
jgi:hypothetical protein